MSLIQKLSAMNDILMSPIRLNELDILIQNSVRKVLGEIIPPISNSDKDEFLTVDEAAAFLKVKRPTIYGYLYNKAIPSLKKRGRVYFKKSALVDWVNEGQRMTRQEISQAAGESLSQ